ncbi:permease-like cell division protein FtsX [Helicovermis profundi]|uniref:Cell division protein FtsX n=1 Tax=Helicovermis profundi TaxID=3065157 RepID=A0AAU9E1M3_9FIRM|nr:permease-like cell division protein FtsX [Clostridia bacterium S502]
MKVRTVSYTFRESIKNLWRNRAMSMASLSSVAATLLILGIIYILIININSLADGVKDQFDTINIYLSDNLTLDDVNTIGDEIYKLEGVKDITFETKEQALEKYKVEWGDNGYLLDGLESNPLPNSYIITLKDIGYANYVVNKIKKMNGVEEVKYYQDIIVKMMSIAKFVRNVGVGLIFILIAISTFIINNTIKLALNSRKTEISIMKYVGATSWFVKWPFLLEGTFLGIMGALVSTGIIYFIYKYTFVLFTSHFYVLIAAYIVNVDIVIKNLLIIFVIIGAGIGALGSIWSMKKYLEV